MKALAKFKRVAIAACTVAAGLFAHATTEKTSYWAWDETKQIVCEKAGGHDAIVIDQAAIAADDASDGFVLEGGAWYVVKDILEVTDRHFRVAEGGTANLILADGAYLHLVDHSLICNEGSVLNIFGQKLCTGKLKVNAGEDVYPAAIGGDENKSNGKIYIHGGVLDARASYGAGIGSGAAESTAADQEEAITIYGGVVRAYSRHGAGIGGASREVAQPGIVGNGGLVRTFGGVVSAMGKEEAPGIGGGRKGTGGEFHADGATIVAQARNTWTPSNPSHGIGGGIDNQNDGSIDVDRSIGYAIYTSYGSASTLETITADELEDDAENGALGDDIYYFSTSHRITLKKNARHVASIKWSYVQQDGSEGSEHDLEGDRTITVQSYLPFGSDPTFYVDWGHLIMQTVVSNGVKVVYTCEDGYTFQDGKKTAEVWIHPTRVRGDIKLEVGGDEHAPYVIPAPVEEKPYHKLSMPSDVDDATWTVTTNGVRDTHVDLAKIPHGTMVTVTWTARPGYVITDGETETFTMIADYEAKKPTVVPAPVPPVSEFFLYPNGDGGKFSPAEKGKKTFLGAIVSTNSGEVAGSISLTLKAPNTKTGLFDISATVKTLTGKKSYSFKAKKIEVPTNDAPYTVHMTIEKKSEHHELDVVFDGDSVTGVFDFENKVDAARDVFATKNDPKQASLKSSFITKWSGLIESDVTNELYSLSAVVSKNGKTKVTVMQADGKKANCSAKAVIGDGVVAVPVTLWTKIGKKKATIGFWLTFEEKDGKPVCAVQRLSAVRDQATEEKLVGLSFTAGNAAVLSVTSKEFKNFKPVFDSAAGKARGDITKSGLKLASNGFITGSLTWGSGKTKVTGKAYGAMVNRVGGATLILKDGTTDIFMVEEPAK